jgi:dihydroorotase
MLIAVHCEDETTIKSNLENIKQSLVTYLLLHILSDLKKLVIFLLQRRLLLPKKNRRVCMFFICLPRNDLFTNKTLKRRKLLPKFVFIIYGLPMMIMQLRESYKMESSRKKRKVLWEALLDGRIDVIATDHALIH